jgi:hypothetical protein
MDQSFSNQFDVQVLLEGGSHPVQFGTNVLAGLIEGIDRFRQDLEQQLGRGLWGPRCSGPSCGWTTLSCYSASPGSLPHAWW